ncbi:hypothetical protein [Rubritalea tangerina]|uniref:hypothetical protein n=1 Tax=Rubritalea tangerina TaxID=430798 RepID=UPI00360C1A0C
MRKGAALFRSMSDWEGEMVNESEAYFAWLCEAEFSVRGSILSVCDVLRCRF